MPASHRNGDRYAPSTLVDLLQLRARQSSLGRGYTYLVDGESVEQHMSFAELDEKARAVAAHLKQIGASGSRALLLFPSGLEYLSAFFGCLYAGTVAVPAYPPRKNRSLDRIDRIATDADATVVLATGDVLGDLESRFAQHHQLHAAHHIATDSIDIAEAEQWEPPRITGETVAFLQYTSGSTGSPKGVVVTHGNLIRNESLIQEAFEMDASTITLGWLPLYHDMGLIGNVLQPLFIGGRCVLMSPAAFLERPIRWLQGMSKYRATTSGGPDFAYDLCTRRIRPEQCEALDLSSWNVAYNGSEPVRAETIDRFTAAFAPYGFRRKAFFPCYGLAEATLFVSGGPRASEPSLLHVDARELARHRIVDVDLGPDSRTLVASGRIWPEQRVSIVDPHTLLHCEEGRVGEIWLSGDCVAEGYWNHEEATRRVFEGHIAGSSNGAALRTGDLGFVRDGMLYVTGRLKDLIVVRGRNHYPQDIEATVATSHPALRPGFGIAFSHEDEQEERLVVVSEVVRSALRTVDVDAVAAAIRRAVSEMHDLQVRSVVLIKTGSIPKTTSGKMQRGRCRAKWLDGTLHVVGSSDILDAQANVRLGASSGDLTAADVLARPSSERPGLVIDFFRGLVARTLKTSEQAIDLDAPLDSLGLDSINIVELNASIESDLDLPPFAEETLAGLSIRRLAATILESIQAGVRAEGEATSTNGSAAADVFAKCATDGGYFGTYRLAKDTYFTQPVLEGPIGPRMRFEGRPVIVWSINDYLGLAGHPHVWGASREAIDEYGTWSPMGSRLLTGNTGLHRELETRLAGYLEKEAAIVFNYGYMGVMGTIASLVGEADTVIIDSLSHACIVDGALLASRGKRFKVFRHNDMESLEDQLKAVNARRRGGVLVVTEGVFGMTGDTAPLEAICDLKDQYDARLFIDDAHGFGTMGARGAGTAEHQGVHDRIDLYFGTFAKSFAAIGGVTAGPESVIDYVRYNARTNVFAKSLPLVYVRAVDAALDLIEGEPGRREQMWYIARRLQLGLAELGYQVGATSSPITPVYIPAGDEQTATKAMTLMRSEFGVFVSAVTYPVVPRGTVLFRLTSTAAHSDDDVDRTLEAFSKLKDRMDFTDAGGDGRAVTTFRDADTDAVS